MIRTKLTTRRETIRRLSGLDLERARGGAADSEGATCPALDSEQTCVPTRLAPQR